MVYVGFVARIVLGALFLVAAWSKARNFGPFLRTTVDIGIPRSLARPAALLLVLCEVALGVLLLSGQASAIAVVAALVLVAVFAGASLAALQLRRVVPCNCFGESGTTLGHRTLVRALALILPIAGYYVASRSGEPMWWPASPDTLIPTLSLVPASVLLSRWLLASEGMAALVSERRSSKGADGAVVGRTAQTSSGDVWKGELSR